MSTQKDHASIGRLAGCGLAGGLIGAMLPPMVGLGSNLFFREFLVLIIGAIALVAGPVLGIVVGMTIYGWQPIAGAANIAAFVLPATVGFTVWGAITNRQSSGGWWRIGGSAPSGIFEPVE